MPYLMGMSPDFITVTNVYMLMCQSLIFQLINIFKWKVETTSTTCMVVISFLLLVKYDAYSM